MALAADDSDAGGKGDTDHPVNRPTEMLHISQALLAVLSGASSGPPRGFLDGRLYLPPYAEIPTIRTERRRTYVLPKGTGAAACDFRQRAW